MGQFQNNKRKNLKEQCLTYLGGKKCQRCGISSLPFSSFDFHHIKGSKEANISQMLNKGLTFDKIKKELDKCIILCRNCHSFVTEFKIKNLEVKIC